MSVTLENLYGPGASVLYEPGRVVQFRLHDPVKSNHASLYSATILRAFTPFSLSMTLLVRLIDETATLPRTLVLKIYDPRFFSTRKGAPPLGSPHQPWSLEVEMLATARRAEWDALRKKLGRTLRYIHPMRYRPSEGDDERGDVDPEKNGDSEESDDSDDSDDSEESDDSEKDEITADGHKEGEGDTTEEGSKFPASDRSEEGGNPTKHENSWYEPVNFEASLQEWAEKLCKTETEAYTRLHGQQGLGVARHYGTGTFICDPSQLRAYTPTVIALEYIVPGISLDRIDPRLISRTVARQLLETVYAFGGCGVIHDDLHRNNILFASSSTEPNGVIDRAVVIDFGKAVLRTDKQRAEKWEKWVQSANNLTDNNVYRVCEDLKARHVCADDSEPSIWGPESDDWVSLT
jgi:hypothetical protein